MSRECLPLMLQDLKTGDSFVLTYGVPIATGETITDVACSINNDRNFTQALTVVKIDDTLTHSQWSISATPEETALWPLQVLRLDIKRTFTTGIVQHTKTFSVTVIKPETP